MKTRPRQRWFLTAALVAASCSIAMGTFAARTAAQIPETASAGKVFAIDDSGTAVLDPVLEMKWPQGDHSGPPSILSATTRVAVQLNMSPWIGRTGRIYMTLPPRGSAGTVRASWTTGGLLQSGRMVSGERALVFNGTVRFDALRDTLNLKIEVDGTRFSVPEALAFGFEFEVES